jgi:capsular polysaccharide biosynthesis protein
MAEYMPEFHKLYVPGDEICYGGDFKDVMLKYADKVNRPLYKSNSVVVPRAGGVSDAMRPVMRKISEGVTRKREIITLIERTSTRKLSNQSVLLDYMASLGYPVEIMVAEELSFDQQMQQAKDSVLLIGAHGAGLTNMIFMQPGSLVIEMNPHGISWGGYRRMAEVFGLKYSASQAIPSGIKIADKNSTSIEVDVADIATKIKSLL